MKKNGFVSTSLIYTFFVIFLLLMIFALNSYSRVRFLLEEFHYEIKDSFFSQSLADMNLEILIYDYNTNEYEVTKNVPPFGYTFDTNLSYCKNESSISYTNGKIIVASKGGDTCYAYFKETEQDILINMFIKNNVDSEEVQVKEIPNNNYSLTYSECTNGATLTFDEVTRSFTVESSYKTVCKVVFTRNEMDLILNFYKEDVMGTHEYNGSKYLSIEEAPGIGYTFQYADCKNNTIIESVEGTNELYIEATEKDECNVYYGGGVDKVEIIIMQETDTGVSGYTTGKKYSRTYSIPSTGYSYVGYICDNSKASVTFENGTLYGESTTQTVCRAYFNRYSDNTKINYFLEKSDGTYESVTNVPALGFVFDRYNCEKGSKLTVVNNVVYVTSSVDDVCNVYYNMAMTDINVLIYVMNRETQKYELGSVPVVGYDMYNAGCTGGASIEYDNSALKVTSDGPTVCTVYFR